MKFRPLIFIAIISLAPSYNSNPPSIPVVNVDNVRSSICLDLSDFLKDIEVIKLETTDYNLFSTEHDLGFTLAFITETSIIIQNDKAIYQFDRQGKYLRKLSGKGRGPNEFYDILFCFADEKKDILYYVDLLSQGRICRIDLSTGQFLDPLELDMNRLELWLGKDNSIYGFPTNKNHAFEAADSDSSVVAFRYDLLSGSMKKYYGTRKYTIQPLGKSMVEYGNHLSLFNMYYSDTLYRLQNNALQARFLVKMKNKMVRYSEGGEDISFLFEYEKGIVLSRNSITYRIMPRGGHVLIYCPERYLLLDPSGGLKNIEQVYINPLDIAVKIEVSLKDRGFEGTNPFPKSSGSYGYILVEQEEDNPHIILGKIK